MDNNGFDENIDNVDNSEEMLPTESSTTTSERVIAFSTCRIGIALPRIVT